MGWCLTPMAWSSYAERREASFRSTEIEAVAWRDEVFARIATWEAWLFDLGGRRFVEAKQPRRGPERPYRYVLVTGTGEALLRTDDRALALRVVQSTREGDANVSLRVERKTPCELLWERAERARERARHLTSVARATYRTSIERLPR